MWTYGEFNDSVFQTFENSGFIFLHLFDLFIFILTGKKKYFCVSYLLGFQENYFLTNALFVVVNLHLETHKHMYTHAIHELLWKNRSKAKALRSRLAVIDISPSLSLSLSLSPGAILLPH